MLQDLARRIGAGIAAALLIGIGAGTTLVAIAFAIYAGLKPLVGPAGASGLTALAAAALTGVGAVILLKMVKPKKRLQNHAAQHEPLHRGFIAEIGTLALGIVADLAAGRRAKRQQKAREAKHRRR